MGNNMSKIIECVLLATCIVFMSGCSTLHFDKGEETNSTRVVEKWHHNAVLALIEVSDPVNLRDECGEKNWVSVKTELSFVNGLSSAIVNYLVPIWYPKTVEVSCQ